MARLLRILCILSIFTLMIVFIAPANAQDFGPGDVVRLIEREIHIPAHPSPGDQSVHLRFISGSEATILAVDEGTGWIEVKGTPLQGDQNVGWITRRYISDLITRGGNGGGPLSWCPPKGSPSPHPSGRLRIATWNLENLHAQDGESIYTGDDPSVKRFAADYKRIRCYVRLFDPDILAVQEVDGEEALSRIVDTDVYDIYVSDRPQGSLNGQQNTGFAFKRGLNVETRPDFEDLDVRDDGSLRYGTRIDLTHNEHTVKLMSVHLKSGCFENDSRSSACTTLLDQIVPLEAWIDDAAEGPEPFILLGDFNRRFNLPNDQVWAAIDDGQPANADLATITQDMPISCRENKYTEFIDHIVFDPRAMQWVDPSSFRHITYRQGDKDDWDKISDHCPLVVEMWIE
jgi:endonuclease/exonuclease/phosphatase family metal-dependent hydrolase